MTQKVIWRIANVVYVIIALDRIVSMINAIAAI